MLSTISANLPESLSSPCSATIVGVRDQTVPAGPELDLRGSLIRSLGAFGEMLPGSLVARSRKCGKPNCRCAAGEELDAGFLLSVGVDGKLRAFHVPAALAQEVRSKVELRKRLDEAAARIAGLDLRRFLRRKEKQPACAAAVVPPMIRVLASTLTVVLHCRPARGRCPTTSRRLPLRAPRAPCSFLPKTRRPALRNRRCPATDSLLPEVHIVCDNIPAVWNKLYIS